MYLKESIILCWYFSLAHIRDGHIVRYMCGKNKRSASPLSLSEIPRPSLASVVLGADACKLELLKLGIRIPWGHHGYSYEKSPKPWMILRVPPMVVALPAPLNWDSMLRQHFPDGCGPHWHRGIPDMWRIRDTVCLCAPQGAAKTTSNCSIASCGITSGNLT